MNPFAAQLILYQTLEYNGSKDSFKRITDTSKCSCFLDRVLGPTEGEISLADLIRTLWETQSRQIWEKMCVHCQDQLPIHAG